jgi:Uma2 family endonuclease
MPTVIPTRPRSHPRRMPEAGECILLQNISWKTYERLLDEVGESSSIRLTYDEGNLEIMSPSRPHDSIKKLIGRMIEALTVELAIPMDCLGSTTIKRPDIRKGLEPDECYYIQNEPRVRQKRDINFKTDPPPDLAVEVDISYHAASRERIYAALGVAEIWLYDGQALHALHRDEDGEYQPAEMSRALPFLRVRDLERFIDMLFNKDQTTIIREFTKWVRKSFAKKRR